MKSALMRFTYFLIFLVAACGMQGQDFDQMVNDLIDQSVPLISVEELAKEKNEVGNVVILDARAKEEFEISHLENAIWVGYEDFKMEGLDIDPQSEIVVYCSVGYRSEKVAEKLEEAGYKHVRNLHGGIFKWMNSGYPVVDGREEETQKVHPYDDSWGKWLTKGVKTYE